MYRQNQSYFYIAVIIQWVYSMINQQMLEEDPMSVKTYIFDVPFTYIYNTQPLPFLCQISCHIITILALCVILTVIFKNW